MRGETSVTPQNVQVPAAPGRALWNEVIQPLEVSTVRGPRVGWSHAEAMQLRRANALINAWGFRSATISEFTSQKG